MDKLKDFGVNNMVTRSYCDRPVDEFDVAAAESINEFSSTSECQHIMPLFELFEKECKSLKELQKEIANGNAECKLLSHVNHQAKKLKYLSHAAINFAKIDPCFIRICNDLQKKQPKLKWNY